MEDWVWGWLLAHNPSVNVFIIQNGKEEINAKIKGFLRETRRQPYIMPWSGQANKD